MQKNRVTYPIIISAPTAAGKTTLRDSILKTFSNFSEKVITATTRKPRDGEVDGEHYIFLSTDEFLKKVDNNEFVEYSEVYGNLYGCLKTSIDVILENNKYPVVILDVVGREKLLKSFPDSISIFIHPGCSIEEIRKRLEERNSTEEDIKNRLEQFDNEIEQSSKYDVVVNNDTPIEETIEKLREVFTRILNKNNVIDDNTQKLISIFFSSNEVQLFSLIEGMLSMIYTISIQVSSGKLVPDDKLEKEMADIKNSVLLAVQYTAKFGVKNPLDDYFDPNIMSEEERGNYKTPSQEYENWFNFWNSWKMSLTESQWGEVNLALTNDTQVPYLPKKRWNE